MPFPTTSVHSVSPSRKLTSQFDVGLGDFAAFEAEPSKADDAVDSTSDDPQSKVDPGDDEQQLNVPDGDGNGCTDDDEQQQEQPDIRQMTARQLRNLCKSHNLTVRGRKDEILSRLKDVLKIDCEDGSGDFQADESNDESLWFRQGVLDREDEAKLRKCAKDMGMMVEESFLKAHVHVVCNVQHIEHTMMWACCGELGASKGSPMLSGANAGHKLVMSLALAGKRVMDLEFLLTGARKAASLKYMQATSVFVTPGQICELYFSKPVCHGSKGVYYAPRAALGSLQVRSRHEALGSLQVRSRPCREVKAPERYSPQSSVHDDADSDWDGISLDEDASVHSLSSDSSEARSIV